MPVKGAEWIAEIRFPGKEEWKQHCRSYFFRSAVSVVLSIFVEKKLHFEPPFCFIFVLGCKKTKPKQTQSSSSKIVLADFKQFYFLMN